ncbi:MAG: hypothetical protein DMG65_22195 [Candidatus Angelobacter sp. Gp1-AA117]|nr:MAG: hypothetical protein DMG65_22195 [Candidatus Angelobacter sp. Gp1-AA117]
MLKYHTIERHVAKSYDYLATRLKEDNTLKAASTFTDRATAESAISKVLIRFADYIVKKSAQGKKSIYLPNERGGIDIGMPIGVVLTRSGVLCTTTRLRLSLRVSKEGNSTFFIKTAYPTL